MKYLKTTWKHDITMAPIEIWSEIDDLRNEHRKVEIFQSGEYQGASKFVCGLTTDLSLEPLPSIDKINNDPQFFTEEVSKGEFEEIWDRWEKSIME